MAAKNILLTLASPAKHSAFSVTIATLLIWLTFGTLPSTTQADDARTMSVRVVDDTTGKPISDASVRVGIWEIKRTGKFPTKTYTTDGKGLAELKIPKRIRILRLWPSKSEYVPLFINFGLGMHKEGLLVPEQYEFRLQKGNLLSGIVVDASGDPIRDAKVQVMVETEESGGKDPQPTISTWLAEDEAAAITDRDGRWEINNAPKQKEDVAEKGSCDFEFQLMVTHPDFAGDSKWGELQAEQGVTTEQLRSGTATLTLEPGIAITGLITGPDKKPVKGGLVVWSEHPYWATGVNETQITDGRYETLRLNPGEYPVTVLAPGFAPQQQKINVKDGLKEIDFRLKAGNPIKIRIVDPSGEPVAKAYIRIERWRGTEAIYNDKHSNVPDSGIPRRADDNGIYAWDWAPQDGVEYSISASGYGQKSVTLVAKTQPHEVVLPRPMTIFGKVVDAQSSRPVKAFEVLPVKVFRPDFYSTDFQKGNTAQGTDGAYKIQIDKDGANGERYRVRIEAKGYRTAFGQQSIAAGDAPLEEDFALEPVDSLVGKVVDPSGKGVSEFSVVVGTATVASRFNLDRMETSFSKAFRVKDSDQLELPATFEPRRIRVFNESGFAEIYRKPDQPIGVIELQPWASVSGRLIQNGKPIGNQAIYFQPMIRRGLTEARFQESYSAKTDSYGDFRFDRLPPISGSVRASLGPWEDSVLTSSKSVPLNLAAGQHEIVSLGGGPTLVTEQNPTLVTGQVVATGRSNDGFSKSWSINFLVSRDRGVAFPHADKLTFNPTGPPNPSWLDQPDFRSWMSSREYYFVKLPEDGRFQIHGVPHGDYDFVIQLYEQPTGCLVETVGQEVVPIQITKSDADKGKVDLGDVNVLCRIGPRVGSSMRAFEFTNAEGRVQSVYQMGGRHLLFHVWSSWCEPCLASMPDVQSTIEKHVSKPLTVVGLNVDSDTDRAKQLVKDGNWNWSQNYLGAKSDMMKQLALSTVPAYYLIGPDGKLTASANSWEGIKDDVESALESSLKTMQEEEK